MTQILKSKFLLILFTTLLPSTLCASTPTESDTLDIQHLLRQMPESVLILLTHNDCLDLLDYASAGAQAIVKNRLGGKTTLRHIDNNHAQIDLTPNTTVFINLQPSDKKIIVDKQTVVEGISSHRELYYDLHWQQIRLSK